MDAGAGLALAGLRYASSRVVLNGMRSEMDSGVRALALMRASRRARVGRDLFAESPSSERLKGHSA